MKNKMLKSILCVVMALILCIPSIAFAEEVKQPAGTTDNDIYGLISDDQYKEDEVPVEVISLSFNDVSDNDAAKKVGFLVKMDFMTVGEGKFRPDDNFTRYEFAYAIKNILNSAGTDKISKFNDMKSNDERLAVMSYAYENGYLELKNNKAIKPDDGVTAKEVLHAFLVAMGYDNLIETYNKEGKDGLYYAAKDSGLMDGTKKYGNTKLTRLDAANFIYNAVSSPVNKLNYVLAGNNNDIYGIGYTQYDDITLLSMYHNIYQGEGILNSTITSGLGDYTATKKDEVRIDDTLYKNSEYSVYDFFGYNTEFYYRYDNTKSPYRELVYMTKSSSVEEITVNSDDIISFANNTLTYHNGRNVTRRTVTKSFELIKNGKSVKNISTKDILPENGSVTLVANDSDEFDTMIVWEYYNAVVKGLSANGSELKISLDYSDKPIEVDLNKKIVDIFEGKKRMDVAITTTEYYDGDGFKQVRTNLPNVQAGSLISIYADTVEEFGDAGNERVRVSADSSYIKIIVNPTVVEGTVSTISYDSNNKISDIGLLVDDKIYNLLIASTNLMDRNDKQLSIGVTGKFYVDCNNKIAAWRDMGVGDVFSYGYLINAQIQDGLDQEIRFKILDTEGEIKLYDSASRVKLNGSIEKKSTTIMSKLNNSAILINSEFTISQIIKYKLDSEEKIRELETVTAKLGVALGYEKGHLHRNTEKTSMFYLPGWGNAFVQKENVKDTHITHDETFKPNEVDMSYYVGAPEVMFCVPEIETLDDDKQFSVTDKWPSTEWIDAELYDANDDLKPGACVVYAKSKETYLAKPTMVVDKVKTVLTEEGDIVNALSGFVGTGGYITYPLDESCELNDVKHGSIVLLSGKNSKVYDIEKIYDIKKDVMDKDMSAADMKNMIVSAQKTPDSDYRYYINRYEAFDFNEPTRTIILQRGALKGDGSIERDYKRASWWVTEWRQEGGAVTVDYDTETGEMTFKQGTYGDIKTAKEYGNDNASRIVLMENYGYGMRFIIIINKI